MAPLVMGSAAVGTSPSGEGEPTRGLAAADATPALARALPVPPRAPEAMPSSDGGGEEEVVVFAAALPPPLLIIVVVVVFLRRSARAASSRSSRTLALVASAAAHSSSAPRTSPHDLNTNGKPRTPG